MIDIIRYQIIMYVIMVIVGICFNAMNALAYRISDIYLSTTLFYAGLADYCVFEWFGSQYMCCLMHLLGRPIHHKKCLRSGCLFI